MAALALPFICLAFSGCTSERHFAADTLWPFGNPNAPLTNSETAQRALGQTPEVTPIAPQAGNVWPGAVQPVPTIADIEKNMNTPLGQAYTPSLPSPYPPGQLPPPDSDHLDDYTVPPVSDAAAPSLGAPNSPAAAISAPGANPASPLPTVPGNQHARE